MRLQNILTKIISLGQECFVSGKEVMEGAIIAHETLHTIHSKQSPAVMIKLDMRKAYDQVQWPFLFKVL